MSTLTFLDWIAQNDDNDEHNDDLNDDDDEGPAFQDPSK